MLREDLNLVQKDFAEQLKISYSTYHKLEKGLIENPGINLIYNIAKSCNVSMDWLCDLSEIQSSHDTIRLLSKLKEQPGIIKRLLNIFKDEDNFQILLIVLELLNDKKKISTINNIIVTN